MSAKDTMTTSLTALAMSDVIFSCFNLLYIAAASLLVSGYPVMFNVDLRSLQLVALAWQRPPFHKISSLITTLVSCERSLCVVKPFLVKRIFTQRRCIYCLIGICVIVFSIFLPVYANGRLVWGNPKNSTELALVASFTPQRPIYESVVLLAALIIVWFTQILILISAVMMSVALRRHQKFRKSMTGDLNTETSHNKAIGEKVGSTKNNKNEDKNEISKASKQQASYAKEDRLIKTVLILAVMHIVLNCPLSVYYVAYVAYPDFRPYGKHHYLSIFITDIVFILQSMNGVFNIFVYFAMNTKYREVFKQVFCSR